MKAHQRTCYTVRILECGPCGVKHDAFNAVCDAVETAMHCLDLRGHLFVSIIGANAIQVGDDACFAMYQQQMFHVVVCGGDEPEGLEGDRDGWLEEIKLSTIHEIIHYKQDLLGTLTGSNENEREAVSESQRIYEEYYAD